MQSHRIRLLLNLLVDASLLKLPARIARTIQRLSLSHGKTDDSGKLYIVISHDEIARFVVASRQSTSIELKKLEQSEIISIKYGKIYIKDPQAIEKFCDQLSSFETITPVYDNKTK